MMRKQDDTRKLQDNKSRSDPAATEKKSDSRVKFEVYGEEIVEKVAKLCGNSARVYLPTDWVGSRIKIIRID
jgi:putative transposon-encoded protein